MAIYEQIERQIKSQAKVFMSASAIGIICSKRSNKIEIAILVSSLVFGLGHIPGMLGMEIGVILFKLISTVGMGFYFGVIYKKTNNLWIPILMHAFIDIWRLCHRNRNRQTKIRKHFSRIKRQRKRWGKR